MSRSSRTMKKMRRRRNREALLITVILLAAVIGLSVYTARLKDRSREYADQEQALNLLIDQEQARSEELRERGIFMNTRDYIERIAREKLGLADPEDTIVKPDE